MVISNPYTFLRPVSIPGNNLDPMAFYPMAPLIVVTGIPDPFGDRGNPYLLPLPMAPVVILTIMVPESGAR